jgi:GrpB-like predicted nucleotidyltransferase (UPF0157 family)
MLPVRNWTSANIAPYDPSWPDAFHLEARRIQDGLRDLAYRVEHVGSTSVPGLAAKPIIDMLVVTESVSDALHCTGQLEHLGYTHAEHPIAFFHQPIQWPHTHHVHVREAGHADACRWLLFRDWLRTHPRDLRAYETLKRSLAHGADLSLSENRARYSEAKTEFIRDVERKAGRARRFASE